MKKFFALACIALLIGCTEKPPKNAEQKETTVELFDESQVITPIDTNEVRQRVAEIYDEVTALYNKGAEATDGALAMFNEMFLSAEFRKADSLLLADTTVAVYPEYDHWIQGQDWKQLSYSIRSVNTLPECRAMVQLTINNGSQPQDLQLVLVKEGEQWMIDDFVTEFSERQELTEMLDKP